MTTQQIPQQPTGHADDSSGRWTGPRLIGLGAVTLAVALTVIYILAQFGKP